MKSCLTKQAAARAGPAKHGNVRGIRFQKPSHVLAALTMRITVEADIREGGHVLRPAGVSRKGAVTYKRGAARRSCDFERRTRRRL